MNALRTKLALAVVQGLFTEEQAEVIANTTEEYWDSEAWTNVEEGAVLELLCSEGS